MYFKFSQGKFVYSDWTSLHKALQVFARKAQESLGYGICHQDDGSVILEINLGSKTNELLKQMAGLEDLVIGIGGQVVETLGDKLTFRYPHGEFDPDVLVQIYRYLGGLLANETIKFALIQGPDDIVFIDIFVNPSSVEAGRVKLFMSRSGCKQVIR